MPEALNACVVCSDWDFLGFCHTWVTWLNDSVSGMIFRPLKPETEKVKTCVGLFRSLQTDCDHNEIVRLLWRRPSGIIVLGSLKRMFLQSTSKYCDASVCSRHAASCAFLVFTARCTLVQSAVLRLHVVCLSVCASVCPSVTLVDCDHIGWNSSKIISPFVSLGCSLFATPK